MPGEINFGALSPGLDYAGMIQSFGQGQLQQDRQTQNDIQQVQLKRQAAADQRDVAFRSATSAAINPDGSIDAGKVRSAYLANGDPAGAMSMDDHIAATKKAQLDYAVTQNKALSQMIGSAVDENSYQAAKTNAAKLGVDTSSLPASFDPKVVGQMQLQALDVKDKLTLQQKQMEDAEKARHNVQDENNTQAGQAVAMRGQNMSAATASAERSVQMRGQNLTDARDQQKIGFQRDLLSRSTLSSADVDFYAQQVAKGDTSPLLSLGRGTQGAANVVAIRSRAAQLQQQGGMTGADAAAQTLAYGGQKASARTMGNISAKVDYGANELNASIPLAQAASANVPRGQFVPFNRVQQAVASGTSSPAQKDFALKTQATINAYNLVAARAGSSVGEREHNAALLRTADSPQAYQAALNAMQQETGVALGASKKTMSDVTGTRQPAAAAPAANVIRYDARGNRLP